MKNKLGKEIRLCKAKDLDFSLKYKWTQAALVPRKDYFSQYACPFLDIPDKPGIYLFVFPNGSQGGQAQNLEQRFTEHFFQFYSPRCEDWHNSFGLKSWKAAKYFLLDKCWYGYIVLDRKELDLYERSALAQIVNNNMTEKYYNTVFYRKEEETE